MLGIFLSTLKEMNEKAGRGGKWGCVKCKFAVNLFMLIYDLKFYNYY